jgi:hypothetical protein
MALILLLVAVALAAPAGASAATPSCAGGRVGTAKRDIIVGGRGADRIRGRSGDDVLRSEPDFAVSGARDCLDGGPGRDHLYGGGGADQLVGGSGADVIYGEYDYSDARSEGAGDLVLAGPGDDVVYAGPGVNRVDAGPGDDTVHAANGRAETVRCGPGRDRVGADFDDVLLGCERVRRLRSPFPRATPSRGGRFTTFVVRWRTLDGVTTADPLGRGYGEVGSERYVAAVAARRAGGCRDGGAVARTRSGYRRNATVELVLAAPRGGWCPGTHRVALRHSWVEDVTEPPPDSCDTPESGSSQCEDNPPETESHRELFARPAFRVG